ncbi:ParB/RepB/Spo0J family partition protein [Planotetraspora sp. GP83]|uniref:ParB/RepB/Spo0J family partition protein n=1 Tax=Planotetraspora sp. GP83 TaxID=3156264 RepID=UPI003518EF82
MTATATEHGIRTALKMVPIDRIDRDEDQPRQHFDPEALNELADSIRLIGLLQPISVRYIPSTRRYKIIAGERRWRACQLAGVTEMACQVTHGVGEDDPETFAKQVAENVGRVDMTPMEEGAAFRKLMELGYSMEQVAKTTGKSLNFVELRLDLLKLTDPMKDALLKGHLPVGLAWYVAKLHADNQNRFLARFSRGEFPTIRDAEAFAQVCRRAEEEHASQGTFFVLADERAVHVAGTNRQEGLFVPAELPDAERERIANERRQLLGKFDRLAVFGTLLEEIAKMDPAELAGVLAAAPGGVGACKARIDHLKDIVGKTSTTLRQAQAAAHVMAGSALLVDPTLTGDTADAQDAA